MQIASPRRDTVIQQLGGGSGADLGKPGRQLASQSRSPRSAEAQSHPATRGAASGNVGGAGRRPSSLPPPLSIPSLVS